MNVLLVGCGSMGRLFLQKWANRLTEKDRIVVVQPSLSAQPFFAQFLAVSFVASPDAIPADWLPDVVFIALKPQNMKDAIPAYKHFQNGALFLSLVAGASLMSFQEYLGPNACVARIMPNVGLQIGESITLSFMPESLRPRFQATVEKLLTGAGAVLWLDDEPLLERLTAISGCGPAYVFLLVEALTHANIAQGASPEMASTIATQVLIGSARLLQQEEASAEELRESVTSSGGMTEAALGVLKDPLFSLIHDAVIAALERQKELGA